MIVVRRGGSRIAVARASGAAAQITRTSDSLWARTGHDAAEVPGTDLRKFCVIATLSSLRSGDRWAHQAGRRPRPMRARVEKAVLRIVRSAKRQLREPARRKKRGKVRRRRGDRGQANP